MQEFSCAHYLLSERSKQKDYALLRVRWQLVVGELLGNSQRVNEFHLKVDD